MTDSGPGTLHGLDGAERQAVASRMWQAWRSEGRSAAVLTGISGAGKSEGVVRPLMAWAAQDGVPTVGIEVPIESTNMDATLVGHLVEEVRGGDRVTSALEITDTSSFFAAARALLRAGALVVIDEFQRLLDAEGRPLPYMAPIIDKLVRRPADGGCLWLISSRRVDWAWTEKFLVVELEPPRARDAIEIVLANLAGADTDTRFPPARRPEIVQRLGFNPRVLRLLGLLLQSYTLEELLRPIEGGLDPFDSRLVDDIERTLLAKAAEGLSPEARAFLRALSVVRGWVGWPLLVAMCAGERAARDHLSAFRERFLIRALSRPGQSDSQLSARYQVHPLVVEADEVRLRRDDDAWRSAHRRAAEWYAQPLLSAGRTPVGDDRLTAALDGAIRHLTAIGADDELASIIEPARGYIDRRYGLNAPLPATPGERDARITLLTMFNSRWGTPGTCYHLAVLLRRRGEPGDLVKALSQAQKSTKDQNTHTQWIEWVRLERAVNGLEAGVVAARTATTRIDPGRNLFAAYQLLGGYLSHLGRVAEAVEALKEGAVTASTSQYRLNEEAVWFAAAEPTDAMLDDLSAWLAENSKDLSVSLARILALQRRNLWRDAALLARETRRTSTTNIHTVQHEALSWLGAGDPAEAQHALDTYRRSGSHEPRTGLTWLVAFVALQAGNLPRAARFTGFYLDTATPPVTSQDIRAALLRAWDTQVAIMGESIPSLNFPVLPAALTGQPGVVVRPQYGDPVLPQHRIGDPGLMPRDRLHVVSLATEWSSSHGGLSTFNRQLCAALATHGARVTCVVLEATVAEVKDAADNNVTLLTAPRTPGASNLERLSRRPPPLVTDEPDILIGHGRITGPAAHRLGDDFPNAKRLHFIHMIPDDIERHKLERGVDIGALAEERQGIELDLSMDATAAVAVGPRMFNWFLRDLQARGVDKQRVLRFDPGFDAESSAARTPPDGAPWMVLAFGRTEDHRLKGLDLAARAFAIACKRRRADAPALELLVRGAPPNTSAALEEQMRGWAEDRSVPIRVRPYSTDAERLMADLRAASLVLMPSRAEGFGLVAQEAIVAKVPVLVSSASGLGELLERHDLLRPEEAARVVVPTTGDDDRDVDEWGRGIESMLRDREAAFSWAADLQNRLAAQQTWGKAVTSLLATLDDLERNA